MSDLILTGYVEDGKLKVKIVKDSEEFWRNLVVRLKERWNHATYRQTIERWQKDETRSFGDHALEHVTYWVLVKKEELEHSEAKQRVKELDLYQRLKIIEHLF